MWGIAMKLKHVLLPVLLCLMTLGCAPKGRPVAQITTRQGMNYLLIDPKANYVRVCWEGEIDAFKNVAWQGLRIDSSEVKAPSQEEQEIPWEKIDRVDFGAPSGDLGEFCPGLPESIAAEVHYKDGHSEHHTLEDTTDDGIEGLGERGKLTIPLRAIAKLQMVPDQEWHWSEAPQRNYDVTLRVTDIDGKTEEIKNPSVQLQHNKQHGGDTLISPFSDYSEGFPALIGGAEVEVPWNTLKSVDFEYAAGTGLKAKLGYGDGHTEEVGVQEASLEYGFGANVMLFDNLKHMDVQTALQPEPKSGS